MLSKRSHLQVSASRPRQKRASHSHSSTNAPYPSAASLRMEESNQQPARPASYPLQRGTACLSCRKRKMKCDGTKPVCMVCQKANRAGDCEYDDGKTKSRTQLLQEKVQKLEGRIRELEGTPSRQASTSSTSSATYSTNLVHAAPAGAFFDDPTAFASFGAPFSHSPPIGVGAFASSSRSSPSSSDIGHGSSSAWAIDPLVGQMSHMMSGSSHADTTWDLSSSIHSSSTVGTQWWESEDLPPRIRQTLLDIFLPHRRQCGLEINVPVFLASLSQPHPQRPHPALLNAIYLLACHLSEDPALAQHEPGFLSRARQSAAHALEHSDRLVNFIQASCLIAVYFYAKGRMTEGYHQLGATARFAVGLGLHKITSDVFRAPDAAASTISTSSLGQREPLLPPPRTPEELNERILTFWQVFNLDRFWSAAAGWPSALPADDDPQNRIDTIWPRSLQEYETGSVGDNHSTVRSLTSRDTPSPYARPDSISALLSKSIALYDGASRLSSYITPGKQPSDSFYTSFRNLDQAITRLASTLPHVRTFEPPPRGMAQESGLNHTLVLVHTLVWVASIQLHNIFAPSDATSYQKCLAAATNATAISREITETDISFLDPMLGPAWMRVAEVLTRELVGRQGRSDLNQARAISLELDALIHVMKSLGLLFPSVAFQAVKVEESKSNATRGARLG